MNRLKAELTKRGIIYDEDVFDEWQQSEELVRITDDYIITVWSTAVLPAELHIYNLRTLEFIGSQNVFPKMTFSGFRTWNSMV